MPLFVRVFTCALLLFVVQWQANAEPLSLDHAVEIAVVNNPNLSAIQARADALAQLPSQMEALPDPRLSINLMNLPVDSFSLTQEGMTQFQISFTQALPYPGKLSLKAKAATERAEAARFTIEEGTLQLKSSVKHTWWDIFYLDRALDTVEKNKKLLNQFFELAETHYKVGKGAQTDVLLAQLEVVKLTNKKIALNRQKSNANVRLNNLLNRAVETPVIISSQVDEKLMKLKSREELVIMAKKQSPALIAKQRMVESSNSAVSLARKNRMPDFMTGISYGVRAGENMDGSSRAHLASLMFSMNLPLYSEKKQEPHVDQRNAEWMQQKYELQDKNNLTMLQVENAVINYKAASSQAKLFKELIIPQANQTVEAMMVGYQVGNNDFLTLLNSQTMLYNYQTQYWKVLSVANQALADLIAAVGEESIYE